MIFREELDEQLGALLLWLFLLPFAISAPRNSQASRPGASGNYGPRGVTRALESKL